MSILDRLTGVELTNPGVLWDEGTGYFISSDGEIMKRGTFLHDSTGYFIDEDGRIMKRGMVLNDSTGYRIREDGSILKESGFLNQILSPAETMLKIGDDGSLNKRGFLTSERVNWPTNIASDLSSGASEGSISEAGHIHQQHESVGENPARLDETDPDDSGSPDYSGRGYEGLSWDEISAETFAGLMIVDGEVNLQKFKEYVARVEFVGREKLLDMARRLYYKGKAAADARNLPLHRSIQDMQRLVEQKYASWLPELKDVYKYYYLQGSNSLVLFLAIPIALVLLVLFGVNLPFLAALKYAVILGLFVSFVSCRIMSLPKNHRHMVTKERSALVLNLRVSPEKAETLAPFDRAWMWALLTPRKPKDWERNSRLFREGIDNWI